MKQEKMKMNKTILKKKLHKKIIIIKKKENKKRTLKVFDYLNNGGQNAKKNRQ